MAVGETPTSLANVPVTEHSYVKETLPVHVRMFERHRVANLRSVIRTIVEAELKFHCKAVQELSTVLKTLATTSEDDMK